MVNIIYFSNWNRKIFYSNLIKLKQNLIKFNKNQKLFFVQYFFNLSKILSNHFNHISITIRFIPTKVNKFISWFFFFFIFKNTFFFFLLLSKFIFFYILFILFSRTINFFYSNLHLYQHKIGTKWNYCCWWKWRRWTIKSTQLS